MSPKEQATLAINALVYAAHKGNAEAIASLRDIGLRASAALNDLTSAPPDHPQLPESIREPIRLAHELAKCSERWPVIWDALKEKREPELGKVASKTHGRVHRLNIGATIVKTEGKRQFDLTKPAGFTLHLKRELDEIRKRARLHTHPADLHPELDADGVLSDEQKHRDWKNLAALLPDLDATSIDQWTSAALELCRSRCNGDWKCFDGPPSMTSKAGKITDENGHERTAESAIREKIKSGLRALIPSK